MSTSTLRTPPISEIYDIAVIGGGINGVGIAADAAGRGLSVFLCEKDDLASHTSSASSKLIHGGLRYLEHHEFRLVREALALTGESAFGLLVGERLLVQSHGLLGYAAVNSLSLRQALQFTERYILPMGRAIWSASGTGMLAFPARFFVDFFDRHGFLSVDERADSLMDNHHFHTTGSSFVPISYHEIPQ